ncbi:854_t:CDS:2, partial [Cetraspora pellucida]
NKSCRNCTLIAELFLKNIRDEEDILETIEIENSDNIESLDNDLEDVDDTRDNNTLNTSSKGVTTQLADVINNLSGHEVLRQSAHQSLKTYTEKMVQQMSKVRVAIPKIDRFSIDQPTLLCKILNKTENNKYQLGSKFGIIEVLYFVDKLEPLDTTSFPELDVILSQSGKQDGSK